MRLTIAPLLSALIAVALYAEPYSCGPFLLQPGSAQMTIVIDHESLATATLTYAPSDRGSDAQTLRHDSLKHHIFSLDDLEPDTEYRYSIETDGSDYNSGERTFHTLPTRPSKYRVIAMGDVRSHPEVWHRVSRQILE